MSGDSNIQPFDSQEGETNKVDKTRKKKNTKRSGYKHYCPGWFLYEALPKTLEAAAVVGVPILLAYGANAAYGAKAAPTDHPGDQTRTRYDRSLPTNVPQRGALSSLDHKSVGPDYGNQHDKQSSYLDSVIPSTSQEQHTSKPTEYVIVHHNETVPRNDTSGSNPNDDPEANPQLGGDQGGGNSPITHNPDVQEPHPRNGVEKFGNGSEEGSSLNSAVRKQMDVKGQDSQEGNSDTDKHLHRVDKVNDNHDEKKINVSEVVDYMFKYREEILEILLDHPDETKKMLELVQEDPEMRRSARICRKELQRRQDQTNSTGETIEQRLTNVEANITSINNNLTDVNRNITNIDNNAVGKWGLAYVELLNAVVFAVSGLFVYMWYDRGKRAEKQKSDMTHQEMQRQINELRLRLDGDNPAGGGDQAATTGADVGTVADSATDGAQGGETSQAGARRDSSAAGTRRRGTEAMWVSGRPVRTESAAAAGGRTAGSEWRIMQLLRERSGRGSSAVQPQRTDRASDRAPIVADTDLPARPRNAHLRSDGTEQGEEWEMSSNLGPEQHSSDPFANA